MNYDLTMAIIQNESELLRKYMDKNSLKSCYNDMTRCFDIIKNKKVIGQVPLYMFKRVGHDNIINFLFKGGKL